MTRDTIKQYLDEKWFVVIIGSTLLLLFAWLFVKAKFDLNFMDEAYYLNWYKNAPEYPASSTSFGFVYRPFFLLFNKNVFYLRVFNGLLSFSLALIVCFFLFSSYGSKKSEALKILFLCVSTSSLLIMIRQDVFLATPSYNTLVFQGALVFSIGVLLLKQNSATHHLFSLPLFLVSLGGWLVFLGKPTSAALLSITLIGYLFLSKSFSFRILFNAFLHVIFLFLFSAFIIDQSIPHFIERYTVGLDVMKAYGAGYSANPINMFRLDIDSLALSQSDLIKLVVFTSFIAFIIRLVYSNPSIRVDFFLKLMTFGLLSLVITILLGILEPMFFYFEFYMLFNLAFLIAVLLGLFLSKVKVSHSTVSISILFICMPYMAAFGSGNSYWHLSLSASFFWILSATILLVGSQHIQLNHHGLRFFASLILFLTVTSLWVSAHFPGARLYAIKGNDYIAYKVNEQNTLMINKTLANYFSDLKKQAIKMGLSKNTPIIDLTGQYGLSIFVLDGSPVGMPMLYGGHPGSNIVAEFALDNVDCNTIARSWLLIEPKGYRRLSNQLIERYGVSLERDYQHSEMFRGLMYKGNPYKNGSRLYRKSNKQYLLKPRKNSDEFAVACLKQRASFAN